jgi:preprotein translocase subunit SecG
MNKRKISTIITALFVAVSLFLTVSAFLQFMTAKNTQDNSAHADGTVTNLALFRPHINSAPTKFGGDVTSVTQDPGFFVSYKFYPQNSTQAYSKTLYGINQSQYYNLRVGGSINVYYNAQNPSLNNPNGDQSSSGQLEVLSVVFGAIFVLSLAVFILLMRHKQNLPPSYSNDSYSNITPTVYTTADNSQTAVADEQETNKDKAD